ncbi:UDP-N-acetylglucosamine 1-carboxyvinyltransferase [Candidatus Saccharibacteria bacterium]|nr:UDP-N-acetylglucosamine 1-carboxyvinyltransferase [Candidatus Saccharibacteria bacterium]MBR3377951.1 UDP-N-acetylglucosamine 1-carboxyvinyltransferase [Candidatus Saccharibacteria bacterium]
MKKQADYMVEIGNIIAMARIRKDITQAELAKKIGTSQSAINRIEHGKQNASLEIISKISRALNYQIISINEGATQGFRINGGKELHGSVTINTSKNAAVGLLCASLLNERSTTLRHLAHIEEVYRIIEVLESIGVKTTWVNDGRDLLVEPPKKLELENLDVAAARRTRTIIMMLGPLLHHFKHFRLPYAGGCSLGSRTVEPHLHALKSFGLDVDAVCEPGYYNASVRKIAEGDRKIVLIERGDTVTENALMAAALTPGKTTIVGASPNYMVQDVCFYLQKLGVQIEGIGTTNLVVHGVKRIATEVEYEPSEDPIEAMSFIAAGIVTKSEIEIKRVPIEFLEIELEILRTMGQKMVVSPEYLADNGHTRLADIRLKKSNLKAPIDKIHPMPFPGLNIDSLPFFSVIAATAKGRTLIHDWVFENRAIYSTELANLNAKVELLDAHRVFITGPTNWRPAELMAPPALRPAVVVMLAMLAAPGKSILRNTYSIARGYENFAHRLVELGADIEQLSDI